MKIIDMNTMILDPKVIASNLLDLFSIKNQIFLDLPAVIVPKEQNKNNTSLALLKATNQGIYSINNEIMVVWK